ncbi:unnamed protein product [Acanthoscelides obtectus]|uniref:Uncharacterized protein n=1 Tax=Acanthoscelides obtectus TaxID=200917 RepID=A0A9P0PE61_ACAOB|nr:unnamed protein product [Acanthoscelides obtectus]CAK1677061.1 hypothetical protein AOBTE_LOCUS31086 [Acanthoscelides obtectus]
MQGSSAQVLEDGLSDEQVCFTLEALLHVELNQQFCTTFSILRIDEMVACLCIVCKKQAEYKNLLYKNNTNVNGIKMYITENNCKEPNINIKL